MIIHDKKSTILEELGKDKKDVRYLERAIERGEVVKLEGYYIKRDEFIATAMNLLIKENSELKQQIQQEDTAELKANVEYYEQENEELKDRNKALESILDGLREKGLQIGYGSDF